MPRLPVKPKSPVKRTYKTSAPIGQRSVTHPHPYGPSMSGLPPLIQRFVEIIANEPELARYRALFKAGYKGKENSCKTQASRWLKNDTVLDALVEASRANLRALVPDAVKSLREVIRDKKHPHRTKATVALLDRAGLHAVSESKQTIHHEIDEVALKQKLIAIAERIDLSRLLGRSIVPVQPYEPNSSVEPVPLLLDDEDEDE